MIRYKCPECGKIHSYSGSQTTNPTTTKHGKRFRITDSMVISDEPTTSNGSETTPQLQFNGMVSSLIIALNYAINTIRNKPQVKSKDKNSTWYQYYCDWTRFRDYFMALKNK